MHSMSTTDSMVEPPAREIPERLEARYRRLTHGRLDDLAVADSRGTRLTHRQLWDASSDLLRDLGGHGISAGDRIAVCMPNRAEALVAMLATLRLRAVPVAVPVTAEADGLRYAVERTGARAVLAAEHHRRSVSGEWARQAAADVAHRCRAVTLGDDGEWAWPADEGGTEPAPPELGVDHLLLTSSTTGPPKAVKHDVAALALMNRGLGTRYGLGPTTPLFMASPVGHATGAIQGARLSLYHSAPLILQESWEPEEALRMIAAERCEFTLAATPFLLDLLDAPSTGREPKLATLRTFVCGGAQVPPKLVDRARDEFPDTFVTVLWGMTEGGSTCCPPGAPYDRVVETAGVPWEGLELAVERADGTRVPAGEEGELLMRGPVSFSGYWQQEDVYRASLTEDGYFRTGDLARLDADGYLVITGRIKDLIIRGGVNISPIDTEAALISHPKVAAVAVVGLPDERLGERICAVVQSIGEAPTLEELTSWAGAQGLQRRLWPEAVRTVDAMPTTASGKARKHVLKQRIVEGSL
jgi:cyclohexanecarboxylate-CoA ligase